MHFIIIILLIIVMGINFSQLLFNEEMIMCFSLSLFFSFIFFFSKNKINMLCYTDIKAMYIFFMYIFLINIKSVSMFLNMYNELLRVINISTISEYLVNILVGINSIYYIGILKARFVTVLFSSYWIFRLHVLQALMNVKSLLSGVKCEVMGAVAHDIVLINIITKI